MVAEGLGRQMVAFWRTVRVDSLDQVDLYYRRHLGNDVQYWRFDPPQPGLVGVLEWPKETSKAKRHLYASLGLHKLIHHHSAAVHQGYELVTGLRSTTDEFRASFTLMINSLIRDQIHLRFGQIISPEAGRITANLSFASWLLIERSDDLLPDLRLKDGDRVTFLNVIPIFKEEADRIRSLGHDALFDIWDTERTAVSDWYRDLPLALR